MFWLGIGNGPAPASEWSAASGARPGSGSAPVSDRSDWGPAHMSSGHDVCCEATFQSASIHTSRISSTFENVGSYGHTSMVSGEVCRASKAAA